MWKTKDKLILQHNLPISQDGQSDKKKKKQWKTEKLSDQRNLWRQDNKMQCGCLGWNLEQKEDVNSKDSEIQSLEFS